MRRKCHNCLCRTCLNVCCDRKSCKGKIEECKRYSTFQQISILDMTPKAEYHKAPRHSWDYYGITKEQYRELTAEIQSGRYTALAHSAAYTANEDIAEYILLSVMMNKSYEGVEYVEGLGRISCGRTDFYGYRRLFYHIFDLEIRKNEK